MKLWEIEMGLFIDVTYVAPNGDGYKTGTGMVCETSAETRLAFERVRLAQCGLDHAEFLFDLREDSGDILDTAGLMAHAFETITGEKALSEAEYKELDRVFWVSAEVRASAR